MRTIRHPAQIPLFDPLGHLPANHRKAFLESPEGLFRAAILEVLPVTQLAEHFSAETGRPTKELYAMAGLIQLMEYNNWTTAEAVNQYMWNRMVQLALNLPEHYPEISERTLYRYIKIFQDNDNHLAQRAMDEITAALIEITELDVSKQRLDSTHVFSNMATFGRTRMMGVTIKRFLTQVIRHDNEAYESIDAALRERYAISQGKLFADTAKDPKKHGALREQVALDMAKLIGLFETHEQLKNATTFKNLVQVFDQQCEVVGDEVKVRAKTGGSVIQNPSDLDATYDGHKGPGYQVQFVETCSDANDVQLIVEALAQTAAVSDMKSLTPIVESLAAKDVLPEELLADGGYGSDENVQAAASMGVELVSPTKGNADLSASEASISEALTLDDFVFNDDEIITACPAGHKPASSIHDKATGQTTTVMNAADCNACSFSGECPVKRKPEGYKLKHTAKERRLAERRREEATDVFRERYAKRSALEGTNSGVKQVTGLGQLRVRGKPRVFMAILLKTAGWNIRRASSSARVREFVRNRLESGLLGAIARCFWAPLPLLAAQIRNAAPISLFSHTQLFRGTTSAAA